MIRLTEPLQTKTLSPILTGFDVFGNRLRGNYESMTARITPEEFLHMTAMPPEIYFADGGMTQVYANQNVTQQQNLNVEIVNQLLNRIWLSENQNLTYQDTVYISNALRKIGVRDTKEFMSEVRKYRKEQQTFRELLTGYMEHYDSLKEVSELLTKKEREKEDAPEAENAPVKQRYFLQQSIYDRLQTGAIYQTLANFYRGVEGDKQPIRREQAQMAEQESVSWQILLNRFQNDVFETQTPLLYYKENHYELGGDELLQNEEHILKEMNAAILLQMLRTIFEQENYAIRLQQPQWVQYQSVIFESAENSLKRFVEYHTSSQKRIEAKQYHENIRQIYEEEKNLLTEVAEYATAYEQSEKNLYETENSLLQQFYEDYHYDASQAEPFLEPGEEELEPARLEFLESDEPEERPEQPLRDEVIVHRIDQLENRTREHQRVINELRHEEMLQKNTTIDRVHAISDTLQALEDPQTVLEKYMNAQTHTEQTTKELSERLEQVLPKETIEIFSKVAEYYQNPEAAIRNGDVIVHPEALLQAEMTYVQREQEQQEGMDAAREQQMTYLPEQELQKSMTGDGRLSEPAERLVETQRLLEKTAVYHQQTELQYENEISRIFHEAQRIPVVNEETEQLLGTILHRWTKQQPGETAVHMEETILPPASILHKTVEQGLNEEILEQLLEKKQKLVEKQETVTQTVTQQHVTNEQIRHVTENRMVEELQDLNEEMKKNIQRQMGEISEQVYNRLEKRLQSERRRRGF